MQFLTESTVLREASSAISQANQAKLAVAFWGDGSIERLGLQRDGLNIAVLCNLESGACNPAVIRRLLALAPGRVRSNPRLHSKVYLTNNCAIVGSSNASSNGLAVEGEELCGWIEANVLLTQKAQLSEIEGWFDELFKSSTDITDPMLTQSETIWESRRRNTAVGINFTHDLIEACLAAPQHPAGVELRWHTSLMT